MLFASCKPQQLLQQIFSAVHQAQEMLGFLGQQPTLNQQLQTQDQLPIRDPVSVHLEVNHQLQFSTAIQTANRQILTDLAHNATSDTFTVLM